MMTNGGEIAQMPCFSFEFYIFSSITIIKSSCLRNFIMSSLRCLYRYTAQPQWVPHYRRDAFSAATANILQREHFRSIHYSGWQQRPPNFPCSHARNTLCLNLLQEGEAFCTCWSGRLWFFKRHGEHTASAVSLFILGLMENRFFNVVIRRVA